MAEKVKALAFWERKTGALDGAVEVTNDTETSIARMKDTMRVNIGPGWSVLLLQGAEAEAALNKEKAK